MDIRSLILVLSCAVLALSAFVYGWKFVKKHNYLLGVEMWVVGISSTNAAFFVATGSQVSGEIAHFLDAFSRGFGFPIIAVAGMLVVTHGYRPSIRFDVMAFVASFAATFVLLGVHVFEAVLPYYFLVMWTLLSIYLAYVAKRLLSVGAVPQALALLVALVTSQIIASIYDFYKIPGEETNVVFNFFVLALNTWAYFMPASYYAYCALERAQKDELKFDPNHALRGLEQTSQ
ncbi:hypothetical protein [Cupriavidus sp. CP313]